MRQFVRSFLVIIFLCLSGCNTGIIDETKGMSIPAVSQNDPAIFPVSRFELEWWRDRHNDLADNIIQNQKIIFIGDSITWTWERNETWTELNQKLDNKITNYGFNGDQTQHVIWRLENGEFPVGIDPEFVVLMIGTNNSNRQHEPESTAAGIGEIVKRINAKSRSTTIILMSILPRGSGNDDEITAKNIAINEIIKKYDGYLRIQYLDIYPYYVNGEGALIEELFTEDRIHLTSAGFTLWIEKIMEIIE